MVKNEPRNRSRAFHALIAMSLVALAITIIAPQLPRYEAGTSATAYAKLAWQSIPRRE